MDVRGRSRTVATAVIAVVVAAAGSVSAQSASPTPARVAGSDVASSSVDEVVVGDRVDLEHPTVLGGMSAEELAALPVLDASGTVIGESLSEVVKEARAARALAQAKGLRAARSQRPGKKNGTLNQRKAFGACMPETGGDYPHESTETGGTKNQVSAHGWWRKGECSGSKATVKACLNELWVANNGTSYWVEKKCTSKDIKPAKKDTSKPRMNVRANCSNLKYTGWANWVDVDVHGTWDNNLKLAKYNNVYCRIL